MNHRPLLKLARESISSAIENKPLKIDEKIKKEYSKKLACFVTLTINGELRGCIGSLYPRQELYLDVIENAQNAAFSDPRFPQISMDELKKIKIEVSILSIPKILEFGDSNELINKLTKKEGVIIKKGFQSATYLPQVWGDLSQKEEFLSSLCQKAGLKPSSWKEKDIEVYTYQVEAVKE